MLILARLSAGTRKMAYPWWHKNTGGKKVNHVIEIPIEEYTTPCPFFVNPESDYQSIADIMHENDIRHLPVVVNDRPVGIISERDMLRASKLGDTETMTAAQIMRTDLFTVKLNESLGKVAFEMSAKKIGSALVLDRSGQLFGIFTAIDGLNALVEVLRGELDDPDCVGIVFDKYHDSSLSQKATAGSRVG
jgi:acetoin utilization protein AcuB